MYELLLMPAGIKRNSIKQYSLCPTFMIIFMDLVLHTPPSWLSMPSMVPLDVAAADEGKRGAVSVSCHCEPVEKMCYMCLKPIYKKQPVPKDNRGTASFPLRKEMTHNHFNKITIHPFITSDSPLPWNISHPQSQLA